jgi:glycosyltransferase involved in cell wall biosynthesis
MKIACIAAGAGGMYCGSCLRDNTLAAQLLAAGHDVTLIPLYTPMRTDEESVSSRSVFLGGINVYLQEHSALFRKTPAFLDRLWDLNPVLRLATRRSLKVDPASLGRLTVSTLRGEEGNQKKEVRRLVRFLEEQVRPEVVNLPNTMLSSLAAPIRKALGIPVCCTIQGEDLFLEGLRDPYRSEALGLIRSHAAHVDAYLAVSEYCAGLARDYLGLPAGKIHVVPLGISLEGHGPAPPASNRPFTVGYLARIAPEKGLHVLVEALMHFRQRPGRPESRLRAAGYLGGEHQGYLNGIAARATEWGLEGAFEYVGEVDRAGKIAFLQGLDAFSVPAPYADPKGIFLLEAMANGIPVVQPRHGAFTEIVEKTGGGLLVEPGKPEALAEGLLKLWADPGLRSELASRAVKGVHEHYNAAGMARAAAEVYRSLI